MSYKISNNYNLYLTGVPCDVETFN